MKTRSNRAPCCKNCHFLAKATVSVNGARHRSSWNEQERSDRRINERAAAQCAQGVWDTGIDPHLNSRLDEILLEPRKDSCFFVKVQPGMSFAAAEKLIELWNLKKSYWYAKCALWISIASVVLAALISTL